jgi:hypothetical protein
MVLLLEFLGGYAQSLTGWPLLSGTNTTNRPQELELHDHGSLHKRMAGTDANNTFTVTNPSVPRARPSTPSW